jgi:hypothetical protein
MPGSIQINEQVLDFIKNPRKYNIELRGELQIKGKGSMKLYVISPSLYPSSRKYRALSVDLESIKNVQRSFINMLAASSYEEEMLHKCSDFIRLDINKFWLKFLDEEEEEQFSKYYMDKNLARAKKGIFSSIATAATFIIICYFTFQISIVHVILWSATILGQFPPGIISFTKYYHNWYQVIVFQ